MSEMIERVSKALEEYADAQGKYAGIAYTEFAKVALEAMMQPTEEMYQAGEVEVGCHQIFTSMVRKALENG